MIFFRFSALQLKKKTLILVNGRSKKLCKASFSFSVTQHFSVFQSGLLLQGLNCHWIISISSSLMYFYVITIIFFIVQQQLQGTVSFPTGKKSNCDTHSAQDEQHKVREMFLVFKINAFVTH